MIFRVQKFSAISCSRGRDYSVFPVRHIPKKSKECQELEAASPRKHFLDIEKQSYVDRNVQETEFSVGGRLKNGGISFDSKSQNHKQRLLTSIDNEVEWGMIGFIHSSVVLTCSETRIIMQHSNYGK